MIKMCYNLKRFKISLLNSFNPSLFLIGLQSHGNDIKIRMMIIVKFKFVI